MSSHTQAPFSARNRGAHAHLDRDFPKSARVGLVHLLHDLQRKGYVEGWEEIDLELRRIARVPPISMSSARADAAEIIDKLSWEKVFDFCERLHGHLAIDVGYRDDDGDFQVTTARSQVRPSLLPSSSDCFWKRVSHSNSVTTLSNAVADDIQSNAFRALTLFWEIRDLMPPGVTTRRPSNSSEILLNLTTRMLLRRLCVPSKRLARPCFRTRKPQLSAT